MFTDIAIDLETMGTSPTAPIVAIGACPFNLDEVSHPFYVRVDLESSIRQGAVIDPATVKWWLKQSDAARAELTDPGSTSIMNALTQFSLWLRSKSDTRSVRVWGNGADFDNVILAEAFKRADLDIPWSFWNNRCLRTLAEQAPEVPRVRPEVAHNAMHDAVAQATWARDCMVALNKRASVGVT